MAASALPVYDGYMPADGSARGAQKEGGRDYEAGTLEHGVEGLEGPGSV